MENKEQSEEIQSRRDFFKKAAKSALPILGAVLLANAPTIIKAAEAEPEPMGCSSGGCWYSCYGTCKGTCDNTCSSCNGRCASDCQNTCLGGCQGTCKGGCEGSSYY